MKHSPTGTRRRHGIRLRVVLLVASGVLAPWVILGGLSASTLSDLAARLEGSDDALARSLAGRVEAALRHDFETLSAVGATNPFEADRDVDAVRETLRTALLQSRLLDGVALIAADGATIVEDPLRGHLPREGLLTQERTKEALRSDRPSAVGPFAAADGIARVYLLVPVRDWNGAIAGVVAGISTPNGPAWGALFRSLSPGGGAAVAIVDPSGPVLGDRAASSGPDPHRHGATAAIPGTPWTVVVRMPGGPIAAVLRTFRTRLFVLGPLLLAVALVFAWGAARSLRQPLAVLDASARRIARGEIDEPIPPLGKDEVGSLGASLESMRKALGDSMARITQANQELEARVADRTRELERLNVELRLKDELRRKLLRKTITAQEEERKRIARELHDETCQTLSVLGMQLDAAASSSSSSSVKLAEARAMATRTLDEVHRLIFDLRPSMLDDLGLLPAIRWFAKRRLEPKGIAVRFEFDEIDRRLPPEVETTVFRAVQEVLTNVERHAGADTVLVELSADDDALEIRVEDDGRGFEPLEVEATESGRGLGLMGLRERMELLGGTAAIDSAPDAGTRVVLRVPLAKEGAGV